MPTLIMRLNYSRAIDKAFCITTHINKYRAMVEILKGLSIPFDDDVYHFDIDKLRKLFIEELKSLGLEYIGTTNSHRHIKRIRVISIIMNKPIIAVEYEVRRGYKCSLALDI